MITVGAIFLCMLVKGTVRVPNFPTSTDDFDQDPEPSPDLILSSFFSGLQPVNQEDKLLPRQDTVQHVNIYRNALKKHILGRLESDAETDDTMEGRSDPNSRGSTFLLASLSLATYILNLATFLLKHKVAVLSLLLAALAFPLVLIVGTHNFWL